MSLYLITFACQENLAVFYFITKFIGRLWDNQQFWVYRYFGKVLILELSVHDKNFLNTSHYLIRNWLFQPFKPIRILITLIAGDS